MKKKYLKTIEDIEALRNTDTKVYEDGRTGYYKFVNGVLCFFNTDSFYNLYNAAIEINTRECELYIEVEDEPSEDYIGKLGWVADADNKLKVLCSVLKRYSPEDPFPYEVEAGSYWKFFTPLTPEEVEKYTGYKVVKEK